MQARFLSGSLRPIVHGTRGTRPWWSVNVCTLSPSPKVMAVFNSTFTSLASHHLDDDTDANAGPRRSLCWNITTLPQPLPICRRRRRRVLHSSSTRRFFSLWSHFSSLRNDFHSSEDGCIMVLLDDMVRPTLPVRVRPDSTPYETIHFFKESVFKCL